MNLELWQLICLTIYCGIVIILSLFGFHRYHMMRLFFKYRGEDPVPRQRFDELPGVTVQLPMFNEYHVVDRLLEAVVGLDYPRDRLEIQVLTTRSTKPLTRRVRR